MIDTKSVVIGAGAVGLAALAIEIYRVHTAAPAITSMVAAAGALSVVAPGGVNLTLPPNAAGWVTVNGQPASSPTGPLFLAPSAVPYTIAWTASQQVPQVTVITVTSA